MQWISLAPKQNEEDSRQNNRQTEHLPWKMIVMLL